ncbi:hypothetical protein ACFQFQ_25480 [Sulfitobacter porphyrae]|uniref:Uncharacterized protein n=1 Tax=Sulfitobacter porphyrae TaxID=1246864 RepID=A0ABW2BAM7_9RHOB
MEEFTVIAVRADQLSEYVGSLRAGKEAALSPDGFLLVRVKTVEDLSEIARESSVILDAKVRFCEKSKTVHRLNVSGISYSGQPLLDDLENGKTSIPATQNRTYDILLYVSLKENAFEREFNPNLSHLGHDLHRDAKDICISIRGETWTGLYLQIQLGSTKRRYATLSGINRLLKKSALKGAFPAATL